ncbi:MAG: hypothetical protein U9M97_03910 [Candidatus Hadarchaeota archaeon]|nr:hypothetical protein [Candidatus Hadarchaeota archaeon]
MTHLDHLEQAKIWLSAAKYVFGLEVGTRNRYTVASALAVHAVIKANDSLTTRFLGRVARRHEEAPALFIELVRRNYLSSEEARHRDTLAEAIREKSAADYHAEFFSKRDAEGLIRKVEKFIEMAEKYQEPR